MKRTKGQKQRNRTHGSWFEGQSSSSVPQLQPNGSESHQAKNDKELLVDPSDLEVDVGGHREGDHHAHVQQVHLAPRHLSNLEIEALFWNLIDPKHNGDENPDLLRRTLFAPIPLKLLLSCFFSIGALLPALQVHSTLIDTGRINLNSTRTEDQVQ